MMTAIAQSPKAADLAAERIALRRDVLDWRDHWSVEAEFRLRSLCVHHAAACLAQIKDLPHAELALTRTGYRELPIVAGIVAAAVQTAELLLAEAGAALDVLVAHHLQIEARVAESAGYGGFNAGDLANVGRTAAPFALAAGLGLALPGFATTTSVALFGLVTTSTVSVPILAAGIGGVAVLSALGVVSLSDLRAGQERRLYAAILAELETRVLAPSPQKQSVSLLAGIEAGLARAANTVME